jgi:peptidylprolyl isomerase
VSRVKDGDTVKVHYTGKLEDGTVFDSSKEREPIQITLGRGEVIPGFEEALLNMKVGEKKTARIPVDSAYGSRRADLIVSLDRSRLPTDIQPEVGQYLRIEGESGNSLRVLVKETSEQKVTLDGNHPLAGQDLTFDIELVEIA